MEDLISLLRSLPPNYVAVLLFAHIREAVRAELRAYLDAAWSPVIHGTPRLLSLWDSERQTLAWQIAGEFPVPTSGQRLYSDLETLGHAQLVSEGTDVHGLAKELASTYPDFLIWDEATQSLSFANVEATLSHEDYAEILV